MKKYISWLATLTWAYLIFYLTTLPNFHPTSNSLLSWMLSNGGHFFFFGTLAVLLHIDKLSTKYAILITSVYGLTIEFIQRSIPGRSFSVFDWLLDTLGAISLLTAFKYLSTIKLDGKKTR